MLLPPPDFGATYIDKNTGQPSKDFYNWIKSIYDTTRTAGSVLTVASLPSAIGRAGTRAYVSDANATTFNSIVAGGGANFVPVFSDGTNWKIG